MASKLRKLSRDDREALARVARGTGDAADRRRELLADDAVRVEQACRDARAFGLRARRRADRAVLAALTP